MGPSSSPRPSLARNDGLSSSKWNEKLLEARKSVKLQIAMP